MSAEEEEEEEERFQFTNSCWICDKLFDVGDDRGDDIEVLHTGVATQLSKKVPVIFHNLRGYDSHLIMKEISKLDVKVNVIPNGSEKYMAFTIITNLIFVDSMQFMSSSLDSLVKNLS